MVKYYNSYFYYLFYHQCYLIGLSLQPLNNIMFQDGSSSLIPLGPDDLQSTVSISCTVTVSGSFEWVWIHKGTQLSSSGRYQVWLADATRTSILVINELRLSDAGNYTCRVRHENTVLDSERTNELNLNGKCK